MAKMTARQQLFCEEYLTDLNATQAAIRAGYSEKTAEQAASRLLTNVKVQEYIQERKKERIKRIEITQDAVLKEIAIVAFAVATDYAKVVEREATVEIDGEIVPLLDAEGNPVKYKTVEPVLTDDLTEEQKKALAVIKKGRDGFEIKPHDKMKALEMLGRHLGLWDKKPEADEDEKGNDGFLEALKSEAENVWQEQ
jgi:phage terminase small subunit